MKRALLIALAAGVLLLAAGAGVYVFRTRARTNAPPSSHADQATTPTMPAGSPPPVAPQPTPRGDVTIDPRRQQLIGVKTVPVTRETIDQTVRAVGAVRYDETKQADVNVKVEGWIRDLYVDYTGQPIQRGQPLFTLYSPDLLNTQNEYLLRSRHATSCSNRRSRTLENAPTRSSRPPVNVSLPGICPQKTSARWTRRGAQSTRSSFARPSADLSSRSKP